MPGNSTSNDEASSFDTSGYATESMDRQPDHANDTDDNSAYQEDQTGMIPSLEWEFVEEQLETPYVANGFQMKPMGNRFVGGEKEPPSLRVTMHGEAVEVKEKNWERNPSGPTTQYMNDQQRAAHALALKEGRIAPAVVAEAFAAQHTRIAELTEAAEQMAGDPSKAARREELLQQAGELSELEASGKVSTIFVMDSQGTFYGKGNVAAVSQRDDDGRGVHVHHSSFLAGAAVAGAGEMVVDRQGVITAINDRSGHYKPGLEQATQTMKELQSQQGAHLDNTRLTLNRDDNKITGMANEYLAGGEKVFLTRHTVAEDIKERGKDVREKLDAAAISALPGADTKSVPSVRDQLGKGTGQKPRGDGHHAGHHA